MFQIEELKEILKPSFNWHGARIDFLAKFLMALFTVRSVNLTKIAEAFSGKATIDSHYKRLQRFFRAFPLDLTQITLFVLKHFSTEKSIILALDRTNWKIGQQNLNILTLALVYKGIAIPLIWICLDKRGNSNTKERITLMNRFFEILETKNIKYILADREFIGQEWFKYLNTNINFRIRIKANMMVTNLKGKHVHAFTLFKNLKIGENRVLSGKRQVCEVDLYLIGTKINKGEYVIIATTDSPQTALKDYKKRWNIETLFGCLKSKGFNLEDTHLTHLERVEKLIGVLTLAFCWALLIGEWRYDQKPIRIGKHTRPVKSIFRYGLEHFKNVCLNIIFKREEWCQILNILRLSHST